MPFIAVMAFYVAVTLSLRQTASVADAFQKQSADFVQNGQRLRVFPLFLKTAMGLFLVGVVPTALLMMFGIRLFPVLFGTNWQEAGILAVAIAPWMFTALIVSPLARAVFVFQAQELKFVYDAISLIAVISVFLIGSRLMASLIEVVEWLSFAQILTYVFYFILLVWIITGKRENDD